LLSIDCHTKIENASINTVNPLFFIKPLYWPGYFTDVQANLPKKNSHAFDFPSITKYKCTFSYRKPIKNFSFNVSDISALSKHDRHAIS
jgi:hypothetical protein